MNEDVMRRWIADSLEQRYPPYGGQIGKPERQVEIIPDVIPVETPVEPVEVPVETPAPAVPVEEPVPA